MVGVKVRTGCSTCKTRKVKCDRTKPVCLRCAKARLLCEGYNIVVPHRNQVSTHGINHSGPRSGLVPIDDGLRLQRLAASATVTNDSSSLWDFCRRYVVNEVVCGTSSMFWSATVLASAEQQPSILQALLSLSLAHRARQEDQRLSNHANTQSSQQIKLALKHYYESIAQLKTLLDQPKQCDKIVILIVCLLLVYCDLLIGRFGEGYLHLKNGRTILTQILRAPARHQDKPKLTLLPDSRNPIDELSIEFAALDLQSVNYGSWQTLFVLGDHEDCDSPRIPGAFKSINHAWAYLTMLHNILHHIAGVDAQAGHPSFKRMPWNSDASLRQSRLIVLLRQWKLAFESSPLRPTTSKNAQLSSTWQHYQRCKLMYQYLWIVTENAHHVAKEMEYDRLVSNFSAIVDLCEELAPSMPRISIEAIIIQPLFLVACCCRHPVVRRRCIKILSIPRMEGHWDSSLIKAVTEIKMQAEEEEAGYDHSDDLHAPLDPNWLSSTFPKNARYTDTLMYFTDADYHVLEVQLRRDRPSSTNGSSEVLGEFETRKKVITWPPPPIT